MGDRHSRDEQDRLQIRETIRQAKTLGAYLQENFWPAFSAAGGLLLFLAVAVIVPP